MAGTEQESLEAIYGHAIGETNVFVFSSKVWGQDEQGSVCEENDQH